MRVHVRVCAYVCSHWWIWPLKHVCVRIEPAGMHELVRMSPEMIQLGQCHLGVHYDDRAVSAR